MKTHLFRSATGLDHWMIQDGKDTRFATTQDVAPILEQNKAMVTHNDGYTPSRELRRVASIPLALIAKWREEEGWNAFDAGHDPDVAKKLAQKLMDSEYAHLRTAEGRVGVVGGQLR